MSVSAPKATMVQKKAALTAFVLMALKSGEATIIADSGASRHLTGNCNWFSTLEPLEEKLIFVAANGKIAAMHVGNILVKFSKDVVEWHKGIWTNILYVPSISMALYSTIYAKDLGFLFSHTKQKMTLFCGNMKIGGIRHDMYYTPYICLQNDQSAKVA
jgi:hypothetical protein